MNRIILIGNGFDLAHGIKTSYKDFIYDFWEHKIKEFFKKHHEYDGGILFDKSARYLSGSGYEPVLKELREYDFRTKSGKDIVKKLIGYRDYWQRVTTVFLDALCRHIETKGWVDIENVYYSLLKYRIIGKGNRRSIDLGERPILVNLSGLNNQLIELTNNLVEYLSRISANVKFNPDIDSIIKSPIRKREIAISNISDYYKHCQAISSSTKSDLRFQWHKFGIKESIADVDLRRYNETREKISYEADLTPMAFPEYLCLPDHILLLSFNYTKTTDLYLDDNNPYIEVNQIHGTLDNPQSIIFGYGDELDEDYKKISDLNDNEYLKNVKSIRYLEYDNYRNLLSLMDSDTFQVYIMGHSCGNSDRTLLNTMFEHKNCVSIVPFYYQYNGKDNYIDIVQNVSRCFTDYKLMRDRVVNKTYCIPLPQSNNTSEL